MLIQKEIQRVTMRPNGSEVQVRPEIKDTYIDFLLVGGGGAGGRGKNETNPNEYYGGGGGGGEVIIGSIGIRDSSTCITIGAGGTPSTSTDYCSLEAMIGGKGGNSSIGNYVIAHGGLGGFGNQGGLSGSGCYGAIAFCKTCSVGGGGAAGNGNQASQTTSAGGGVGICGYGTGGQGTNQYCDLCNGCNATCYGGGGGGASHYGCIAGRGMSGVAFICYTTDGSCGINCATGGQYCYTCNGYCVHRFTSDGTFTIVS